MSLSPAASRHGAQLGIPPPSRAPPRAVLYPAPRRRAPCSCPVAVGRDVFARGGSPLAPPHRIARGGSPPRCAAWQVAHAESFAGASPCAPHSRAGRGVRSPHPRPCRGTEPLRPAITPAHYPGGAMVGRRASRLAPYRHYARAIRSPSRSLAAHPPPIARGGSLPAVAHRPPGCANRTETDNEKRKTDV